MARILVVDDNAMVARSLVAQVRRLGHDAVGIAHDGEAAVRSTAEMHPDLMLMDYEMPELDGAAAAREIWRSLAVPSLMVSGHAGGEPVSESSEAGAIGYLVKPVGAADLGPAIDIGLNRARDLREAHEAVASLSTQLVNRKLNRTRERRADGCARPQRRSGLSKAAARESESAMSSRGLGAHGDQRGGRAGLAAVTGPKPRTHARVHQVTGR